ncbi:MAG: FtsQ-type POTRA domain-containing protein [bacterium]|nr:FtsQ-type POTRA domain-containing protein [bacterium]
MRWQGEGRKDRSASVRLRLQAVAPVSEKKRKKTAGRQRGASRAWLRSAIGLLVFVEVLLLSGHAVKWVRSSRFFALGEVVVSGYRALSPEELIRRAALSADVNLFEVDLERVRRQLESHPWVRRAVVRRRIPHALYMEIEERLPAALIRREGMIGVDREGVILGTVPAMKEGCLPFIEGFEKGGGAPGDRIAGSGFRRAMQAAALIGAIPVLRKSCISVAQPEDGRIRVRALGGNVHLLVRDEGMGAQVERLGLLAIRIFQDQTARFTKKFELDLTFPGRIVVRPLEKEGGLRG